MSTVFDVFSGEVPAAVEALIDSKFKIWVQQHAFFGGTLCGEFVRIAYFGFIIVHDGERNAFDRFAVSAWHNDDCIL